jgi:hypothetical protein
MSDDTITGPSLDQAARTAVGALAADPAIAGSTALQPLMAAIVADTKPFWSSKALWSLVVSAIGAVAARYGHPLTAAQQADAVGCVLNALPDVLQYGGLAAAAVFRVTATKRLA